MTIAVDWDVKQQKNLEHLMWAVKIAHGFDCPNLTEKLWIIQIFFLFFFLNIYPNLRGSLYKGKEGVFKIE